MTNGTNSLREALSEGAVNAVDDAYYRADVVAVRVLHDEGMTAEQIAAQTTLSLAEVNALLAEADQ